MTPLRSSLALSPETLRRRADPASFPFRTTEEVEPLVGTVGQPRALDAIDFGLQVATAGYNIFAAGLPGSGRATTIRDYLERASVRRPPADDWVYVHNFRDADRPNAIRLPPGRGQELARDMDEFRPPGGSSLGPSRARTTTAASARSWPPYSGGATPWCRS